MRWAKKRDGTEKDIVEALIGAGCDVERGTDCDLYVRINRNRPLPANDWLNQKYTNRSWLMEVKVPGRKKNLQPIQKRLREIFGSQYVVVASVDEALQAVGVKV